MKWRDPFKLESINVSDINVYPGECLTVWMNRVGRLGERDAEQIEMRVTPEGKIEIFARKNQVGITDWPQWRDEP